MAPLSRIVCRLVLVVASTASVAGSDEQQAFLEIVKHGRTTLALDMLCANPVLTTQQDEAGRTPLHWAAEAGNVRVAKALRDAGAGVGVRDGHGNTPLHLAARSGRAAVVALLISRGANVRALAYNKYTPLHLAAWSGEARTIKRLLAAGADVHAADYSGRAPLNYASTRKAVDLLVRAERKR